MNISSYEKLLLEFDYYGKNKVTQNVSSSENKLVIKKHFNQLLLWLDNYTKNWSSIDMEWSSVNLQWQIRNFINILKDEEIFTIFGNSFLVTTKTEVLNYSWFKWIITRN